MINARELRIGNIYRRKHGKGFTDQAIDEGMMGKIFGNTNEFALNDFENIPISEEWLIQLGFEKSFSHGYLNSQFYRKENYTLNELQGEDAYYAFCEWEDAAEQQGYRRLSQIQYVHQLQNLYFALTGTELSLL